MDLEIMKWNAEMESKPILRSADCNLASCELSPTDRPLITVVISTYNRPDTLVQSIRSVMLQTERRWALLVVGDGCDERTANALKPWAEDARVAYVNLGLRCGEQALPNSAAIALADTPYVALLNHDDLWLPHHLETALESLERSSADLFLGRAIMCNGDCDEATSRLPEIMRVSPESRCLSDSFSFSFEWFEPASAWVMRTDAARRVGAWRPSPDLYRVPLQDWLLRAWRSGLLVASAKSPTCIKVEDHGQVPPGQQRYAFPGVAHRFLMGVIAAGELEKDPLWHQALAGVSIEPWRFFSPLIQRGGKLARWIEFVLRLRFFARLYHRTGCDALIFFSRVLNVSRGRWMQRRLRGRTGENRLSPPGLPAVIEQLQDGLFHQCPAWSGKSHPGTEQSFRRERSGG